MARREKYNTEGDANLLHLWNFFTCDLQARMDDGRGEEEIAQEANVEVISPPAYDWTSLRESYKLEGRFIERHGHAGPEEVFWRRLVW